MKYYNSKKRKNILKVIIVIILVTVLIFLVFLYGSKLFSTNNKNSINNDLEPNQLENFLKKINSDLDIMTNPNLNVQKKQIKKICDNLLKKLENTKKEEEMKCIFDKAVNFFEIRITKEEKLGNIDTKSILQDIVKFINIYKTCLKEFLKIKDQFEENESSEEIGNKQINKNFTQEDLNKGREFLLNYAYILKYFTEDLPNIKKEIQMNESQKNKLKQLEKAIWEYIKELRKETLNNKSERFPTLFSTISRNIS